MKIRKGFVSNSSSSSFIIIGKDTFFPYNKCELSFGQKKRLVKQGFKINPKDVIYLSEFVSDGSCWDWMHDERKDKILEYQNGGHGYPYGEDHYDEIDDNIWLRKENKKICD